VGLLRTHPRGRDSIKIEQSSRRREYSTLIWECNSPPRENLHEAAQGLPPLAQNLVGEILKEPPNSQGCNNVGLLRTHKWERQY
jgi:hypothetical protein